MRFTHYPWIDLMFGMCMIVAPGAAGAADDARQAATQVIIVCEHGSAKSLIAASLFNQAAKMRGLPFRAVSRGIVPDAEVPPKIAAALREEGFDVADYRPQKLTEPEIAASVQVIAIGVDLPSVGGMTAILQWNDIPPASVDYQASHSALERRVHALLDRLAQAQ
ncbi:MAG TPA: hypothetical protein VEC06_01515 [Paucimonas sp.]|nr:hypothetical protein [Paucimonas sp.]